MKNKIPLTFKNYNKKDKITISKIKKILKKDCMMDASVVQLSNYYYGEVTIEITKKQKRAILQLAKIKHEQNKKEAEDWAKCGLFHLAYEQLVKKNKAKKISKNDENWYYKGDITEVVECAGKIISNTCEKNREENQMLNHLRNYCKEVVDGYQRLIA